MGFSLQVNDIDSSPAIGPDGTIYFGDWNGNFHALNPNGTEKWEYHTGNAIPDHPPSEPTASSTAAAKTATSTPSTQTTGR